jgi:hypothetical protein
MNTSVGSIVILGIGKDKKPRAGLFSNDDLETAKKAAGALGFEIGLPESDEAKALIAGLKQGKLYAGAKSFLPLIKRGLIESLRKELTLLAVPPADDQARPIQVAANIDIPPIDPWEAIEPGATVLWSVDPKEGWFPCTVIGISKDRKMLSLRWADFPSFRQFQVKRLTVGVLLKVPPMAKLRRNVSR